MICSVGDIVLLGPVLYEVVAVSDKPIGVFEDGTRHYEYLLKRLNMYHPGDYVYVNDAQVTKVEKEALICEEVGGVKSYILTG